MEIRVKDKLFLALLETSAAHAAKSREAFRNLNCTEGQPKVLYILKRGDGFMQKELAEICKIKQSTLTVLLSKMEHVGYIRKEAEVIAGGKRAFRVYLTEEGHKKADEIEEVVENMEEKSFSGMTEEEKKQLLNLLGKVAENLNK
jgi:DNA-binding MarR family transcriptional regulator